MTGYITFEGESKFDLRALSSYVPQVRIGYSHSWCILLSPLTLSSVKDDALLGVLTVRETIAYALRLSSVTAPMKKREVDELVETTIAALGLSSVQNHKIGNAIQRGISGGQKRRVTIGTSLVTCPKVRLFDSMPLGRLWTFNQILFLDEPTSGLDSTSSRQVMAAVKTMYAFHISSELW